MFRIEDSLVALPRVVRRGFAATVDAVLLAVSLMLAAYLRFGEAGLLDGNYLALAAVAGLAGVGIFWAGGLYREVLRYAGPRMWIRLAACTCVVTLVVGTAALSFSERDISRSVLIAFAVVSTFLCGGVRLIAIQWLAGVRPESGIVGDAAPVLIYGAGASGVGVAAAMSHSPMYRPIAFIDDDVRLAGS
ncbi:MAG: hypothetical protein ACO3NL_04635, partial [Phycisphaerales bacterium]